MDKKEFKNKYIIIIYLFTFININNILYSKQDYDLLQLLSQNIPILQTTIFGESNKHDQNDGYGDPELQALLKKNIITFLNDDQKKKLINELHSKNEPIIEALTYSFHNVFFRNNIKICNNQDADYSKYKEIYIEKYLENVKRIIDTVKKDEENIKKFQNISISKCDFANIIKTRKGAISEGKRNFKEFFIDGKNIEEIIKTNTTENITLNLSPEEAQYLYGLMQNIEFIFQKDILQYALGEKIYSTYNNNKSINIDENLMKNFSEKLSLYDIKQGALNFINSTYYANSHDKKNLKKTYQGLIGDIVFLDSYNTNNKKNDIFHRSKLFNINTQEFDPYIKKLHNKLQKKNHLNNNLLSAVNSFESFYDQLVDSPFVSADIDTQKYLPFFELQRIILKEKLFQNKIAKISNFINMTHEIESSIIKKRLEEKGGISTKSNTWSNKANEIIQSYKNAHNFLLNEYCIKENYIINGFFDIKTFCNAPIQKKNMTENFFSNYSKGDLSFGISQNEDFLYKQFIEDRFKIQNICLINDILSGTNPGVKASFVDNTLMNYSQMKTVDEIKILYENNCFIANIHNEFQVLYSTLKNDNKIHEKNTYIADCNSLINRITHYNKIDKEKAKQYIIYLEELKKGICTDDIKEKVEKLNREMSHSKEKNEKDRYNFSLPLLADELNLLINCGNGARGRKLLLVGSPGTGKSYTAKILANVIQSLIPDKKTIIEDVNFKHMDSKYYGETEEYFRGFFKGIWDQLRKGDNVVVIMDEMTDFFKSRESGSNDQEKSRRQSAINYLLTELEKFSFPAEYKKQGAKGRALLIALGNNPQDFDKALLNRIDTIYVFDKIDEKEYVKILFGQTKNYFPAGVEYFSSYKNMLAFHIEKIQETKAAFRSTERIFQDLATKRRSEMLNSKKKIEYVKKYIESIIERLIDTKKIFTFIKNEKNNFCITSKDPFYKFNSEHHIKSLDDIISFTDNQINQLQYFIDNKIHNHSNDDEIGVDMIDNQIYKCIFQDSTIFYPLLLQCQGKLDDANNKKINELIQLHELYFKDFFNDGLFGKNNSLIEESIKKLHSKEKILKNYNISDGNKGLIGNIKDRTRDYFTDIASGELFQKSNMSEKVQFFSTLSNAIHISTQGIGLTFSFGSAAAAALSDPGTLATSSFGKGCMSIHNNIPLVSQCIPNPTQWFQWNQKLGEDKNAEETLKAWYGNLKNVNQYAIISRQKDILMNYIDTNVKAKINKQENLQHIEGLKNIFTDIVDQPDNNIYDPNNKHIQNLLKAKSEGEENKNAFSTNEEKNAITNKIKEKINVILQCKEKIKNKNEIDASKTILDNNLKYKYFDFSKNSTDDNINKRWFGYRPTGIIGDPLASCLTLYTTACGVATLIDVYRYNFGKNDLKTWKWNFSISNLSFIKIHTDYKKIIEKLRDEGLEITFNKNTAN
jgi:hypothetical protein